MAQQIPEAELIRNTYIIREMDIPPQVKLTKRSLLRWLALSLGLISENESRSTVLDVLDALFYFQFAKAQNPTTEELQSYVREKFSREISEKLMRYHLNRLIALKLLLRRKSRYVFNNSPYAEKQDIKAAFDHWFAGSLSRCTKDIGETLQKLALSYKK